MYCVYSYLSASFLLSVANLALVEYFESTLFGRARLTALVKRKHAIQ